MGRALQDTRAFDGNLHTDVLVDQDDEAPLDHLRTLGHDRTLQVPTADFVPAKVD